MPDEKQGLNVLVVDDARADRMVLSAMLSDMGHRVVQAGSGEEALELFRQSQPDLVLMDVIMPGMGGHAAVSEMRRMAQEWFPIVYTTAMGRVDDIVHGIESGGDDYLIKPVHYKILHAKINSLHQHLLLFRRMEAQSRLLLDHQARNEEERQAAQEFMNRLLALDKIDDPLVRFYLQPAESFSGDLIAVARTPAKNLHALLADSTGHGLTAALAVVPVLQLFHAMSAKGFSIGAIAAEINRKVKEYLPSNRFVAAVLVVLDVDNGRVSVWNGGCPPAVLLDPAGRVVCRFDSSHMPLGILDPDEFDAGLAHYHYGDNHCQLLLCSDGAVDSMDAGSMAGGMARLLEVAQTTDAAARLPRLIGMLDGHLAGRKAHDDIALILMDCPAEDLDEDPALTPPELGRLKTELLGAVAEARHEQIAPIEWQFSLTLTALQLRQADVVPLLLHVVSQVELDSAELSGKLFLILSELFNNALDHGLLGLDSALKQEAQGMDRYFEERAVRLKQLEEGEIRIKMQKISIAHSSCLKIIISDSGEGFDHPASLVPALEAGMRRHGRGIALVKSLSGLLHYFDNGAKAQVCIPLRSAEQCAVSRPNGECEPGQAETPI